MGLDLSSTIIDLYYQQVLFLQLYTMSKRGGYRRASSCWYKLILLGKLSSNYINLTPSIYKAYSFYLTIVILAYPCYNVNYPTNFRQTNSNRGLCYQPLPFPLLQLLYLGFLSSLVVLVATTIRVVAILEQLD